MMNNSGKAVTIFVVVNAIVLICLAGITSYLYYNEREQRENAEYNYEQMKILEEGLQKEWKESKRKISLYEEQLEEADKTIEDKMGEIEFEQGLREELKKENLELRADIEKETKSREYLRAQLSKDLAEAEQTIADLKSDLKAIEAEKEELLKNRDQLETDYEDIKRKLGSLDISVEDLDLTAGSVGEKKDESVELKKIVVNSEGEKEGKVISVDKQTNFVITNLGSRDSIDIGVVLSVYRGNKYLGDVKVTRVLPEMSAADFIPPLKSKSVLKDDQVVVKE
ncbi:MAG: hypothetical protein KAR05_05920 [Candidatus Omnitrophica bacterium]|nr:hypothetical protein [Candidatus Omnitrophota bacterium]